MKKFNLKNAVKGVAAVALAASLLLTGTQSASACTAFYVGNQNTTDGKTYYGRCEDYIPHKAKVFEVRKAADHADGDMYEDAYGFTCPYPAHTLRYTVVRDSLEDGEGGVEGLSYAEVGMNELGVAMSATVSTDYNSKIDAVDPLFDNGLAEISVGNIILQEAKTAKHGIDIVTALLDKYGAGECYSLYIGDKTEVWDLEVLSGHQYIAYRMPANKASVVPNMMMASQVDLSKDDIIASKGLISTAKEARSYVTETPENENSIHIYKSYAKGHSAGSSYRAWMGINYFNPDLAETINPVPVKTIQENDSFMANADVPSAPGPFSLMFDMTKKVGLKDTLNFFALRGNGTKYDADAEGSSIYPIANGRQAECHVFQTDDKLPAEIATTQWLGMKGGEFTLFVPAYANLIKDTASCYKGEALEYFEGSINWAFDAITTICFENRKETAAEVTKYIKTVQDQFILEQGVFENLMKAQIAAGAKRAKLEALATKMAENFAEEALDEAEYVLDSLQKYIDGGKNGAFKLAGRDNVSRVTFDANGGTTNDGYTYVATGSEINVVPEATREGYLFDGWYTMKHNGKKLFTTTKATADVTYYAHWSKVEVAKVTGLTLTAKKNAIKVTYAKDAEAAGYEVQYATNKEMTDATTYVMKGNVKTIKDLVKGTRYYVQVRAFKLDSTGNKVYGEWATKYTKAK